MASFNYSTMQMTVKIVYYGPGLCGKTTNLQHIYDRTTRDSRGEMVSLETQTDRTLFFDLLPIEVGTIASFKTRIQLYTVPGQVFYNTTRKLVLKGVDGVVFVADSQRPMLPSNIESFANLEANLAELGIPIDAIPLVLQYNKRDLPDVLPMEELDASLNTGNFPSLGASAITGEGVFETLRAISKVTLTALKKQLEEGTPAAPKPAPVKPAAPSPPPAAKVAAGGAPKGAPATPPPRPALPAPGAPQPAATAAPAAAPAPKAPVPKPAATRSPATRSSPPSSSAPESPAKRRRTGSGRNLLLNLKPSEFERAHGVRLDLDVEDADRKTVRSVRNVRLALESSSNPRELILQLKIHMRPEEPS